MDEHGLRGAARGHRLGRGVRRRAGAPPRAIIIMVKAGRADRRGDRRARAATSTRATSSIDGGNSHFRDTRRRAAGAARAGHPLPRHGHLGRRGGRAARAEHHARRLARRLRRRRRRCWTTIAAQVGRHALLHHIGPDGAGHYVKMVHNGIEYADMQLIAEAYDLLSERRRPDTAEIARDVPRVEQGELDSFLIEITAQMLPDGRRDGEPLVDVILDKAEQKGTGKWTVADRARPGRAGHRHHRGRLRPLALGASRSSACAAAQCCRARAPALTGRGCLRRRRPAGAVRLQGRVLCPGLRADRRGGSEEYDWDLDLGEIATHLARRLHHPRRVPRPHPRGVRRRARLPNLLLAPYFARGHRERAGRLARGGRGATRLGIPVAGLLLGAGLLRRLHGRGPGPA